MPPEQSRRMHAALKAKGVPVAYLEFEGEQHGFRELKNIVRALEAEAYFYARVFGFTLADPVRAAGHRQPVITLLPFKSIRYAGRAPGPRLIVLGAVHGNETCGTRAIERVMAELDGGALALRGRQRHLRAGEPTRWPMPMARRAGDRNLNRALQPTDAPREFEDHVANWLCPLLAAHEVLLDLHSFHGGGQPFVMVGPQRQRRAAGALCAGRARGSAGALPGRGPRGRRLARHLCRRRGAAPPQCRGRRPRRGAGAGPALRRRHHRVHALGGRLRADAGMRLARRPGLHRGGLARHPQHAGPPGPERRAAAAGRGAWRRCRWSAWSTRQDAADAFVRDWHSFDALQQGEPIAAAPAASCSRAARRLDRLPLRGGAAAAGVVLPGARQPALG